MQLSIMAPTAPSFPQRSKMPATELPDAAHQDRSDQVPPPLSVAGRRAVAPPKHKTVVVLGATGTGKSRLAIDLARRFGGEIINSDKMQVYADLDVATNKVSADECAGVPHHLLGVLPDPDAEFTAADFRREASRAVAAVAARGRVPIVAGGSNSYVEELVDGDRQAFRERYELCFLWVDARLPVLRGFVSRRVEDMLRRGLVEEVAAVFDPRRANYSAGVWRAIGVPELDEYLRASTAGDERERSRRSRTTRSASRAASATRSSASQACGRASTASTPPRCSSTAVATPTRRGSGSSPSRPLTPWGPSCKKTKLSTAAEWLRIPPSSSRPSAAAAVAPTVA
jgi:adenylate dimethylallyltransferase (cytokinin synthase)